MSDTEYIKRLEAQNISISTKLEKSEMELRKARRNKGIYPVFKIIARKGTDDKWVEEHEYVTNCNHPDDIPNVLKFTVKWNLDSKERNKEPENIIGFCFWRQPIKYRWALYGMRKYYDINFKRVENIEVNPDSGAPIYTYKK